MSDTREALKIQLDGLLSVAGEGRDPIAGTVGALVRQLDEHIYARIAEAIQKRSTDVPEAEIAKEPAVALDDMAWKIARDAYYHPGKTAADTAEEIRDLCRRAVAEAKQDAFAAAITYVHASGQAAHEEDEGTVQFICKQLVAGLRAYAAKHESATGALTP